MKENQKTLKQLKIFNKILAWIIAFSFIGIIVGLVMWIWFGTVGFKILLTSVVCTIFFSFWYKGMDKGIKEREEKEIKDKKGERNV